MQTILGAGGAIGMELAKSLREYTNEIRLVGRNPKKINERDQLFPADLTVAEEVEKSVEGSDIVYLTVGFEYKYKVWRKAWPPLMMHVINACKKHGAKPVFFDNVYMYDKEEIPHMTEKSRINPPSKKGQIRAEISQMLMHEVEKGELNALIARAADFYGPKNSLLVEMVIKKLMKGKKADWFGSVDKTHNFTYTPDAGKATAMLGNTGDAFGEIWHLPTDHTKLSVKDWIEMIAGELNAKMRYRVMPEGMMGLFGVFVPILREFKEMIYQYDRDYFFDSSKFQDKFDFTPTNPQEGIQAVIRNI